MNVAPVKMCCVYLLRDGSALVEGVDYEPTGPGGLSSERLIRLSRAAIPDFLGLIVVEMLDRTIVVNGAEWNEKSKTRLEITGEKSGKSFESHARMVNVSLENGRVTVTPGAYDSKYGGWQYLDDRKMECKADPTELTRVILDRANEQL